MEKVEGYQLFGTFIQCNPGLPQRVLHWKQWHKNCKGGNGVCVVVGDAFFIEEADMLILRFPIFHANETEFKNIHQAVDELKALPKWDKTKYYTAGPEYGIILSTETGNHVEMSDLPDHVKTFIHQFSKGYTSIF